MRKRVWIAIVVVCAAFAGIISWQVVKPSDEPVYKGRTLTSWLEDLANAHAQMVPSSTLTRSVLTLREAQVKEAMRQIGTNAIPTLLRMLRMKDSAFKVMVMNLAKSVFENSIIVFQGVRA
jgi:hypothetical protein